MRNDAPPPPSAMKEPTRLQSLFRFLMYRPSSTPLPGFHLKFSYLLLLLLPLCYVFADILELYIISPRPLPSQSSNPLAFNINSFCLSRGIDSGGYLPLCSFLLGFFLYQFHLPLVCVFLLSLFPLFDFGLYSQLMVPSFAAVFALLVIGTFSCWVSLFFRLCCYVWLLLSLLAAVAFLVASSIRPECAVASAVVLVVFYGRLVDLWCRKRARPSWKWKLRLISLASQQLTIGGPVIIVILWLRETTGTAAVAVAWSAAREYEREFREGYETVLTWMVVASAFVAVWFIERRVVVVLFVAAVGIAGVALPFVPFESQDEAVGGKLFSMKVLLLLFTALVFGLTELNRTCTVAVIVILGCAAVFSPLIGSARFENAP
jgi:hypothetical protein